MFLKHISLCGYLNLYLFKVIDSNEKLEKEVKELKDGGGDAGNDDSQTLDELRRLQAQNTVLQKNLTGK